MVIGIALCASVPASFYQYQDGQIKIEAIKAGFQKKKKVWRNCILIASLDILLQKTKSSLYY
jgi:hypothetical protein